MRRLPEDRAEAAAEMGLGDMGHRGHGADVERLGVGAVHGVAGAQQAPVQILGFPAHAATLLRHDVACAHAPMVDVLGDQRRLRCARWPARNGPVGRLPRSSGSRTLRRMDRTRPPRSRSEIIRPAASTGAAADVTPLSRRGFLRSAAVAGGGLAAVGLAACAPGTQGWTFASPVASTQPAASAPPVSAAPASAAPASASPSMDHSPAPSPSGAPLDHDASAKAVVDRFLGGEAATLPLGNQPLEPRLDGDTKVFELTIDKISHRIDATKEPIDALGYNGTWPGPRLTVVEGDKVRAIFTNNLDESTGVHFHGQRVPNAMDGVPHITQEPIQPGQSFTYEFDRPSPWLAHVPLASQRDRSGRARIVGCVHRPAEGGGRPLRAAIRRDPGHRLDQQ